MYAGHRRPGDAEGRACGQRGGVPQLLRTQWIPVGLIVLAVVVDLVTPQDVTSAPLLIAAPVAAAPLCGVRAIIGVGVTAMVVHAFLARVDGTFGWRAGVANQITLAAVTALAVLIHRTLRRGHDRARRAQQVAAVAQRAVLPRPPSRLGDLHIDARYVPAESEALIGGDLYVVQSTPYGIRVMVGDVRGKGLGAVSAVSADLGAFRYAADEAEDLPQLVARLERALLREGAGAAVSSRRRASRPLSSRSSPWTWRPYAWSTGAIRPPYSWTCRAAPPFSRRPRRRPRWA